MPKKASLPVVAAPAPEKNPSTSSVSESATFQQAYERLQAAVQTVRQADVADLDTLLACVKEGADAHAQCKARLQAVRALLAQYDAPEPLTE